jgi:type II secretory pathway component GspD/PulD (secretin)
MKSHRTEMAIQLVRALLLMCGCVGMSGCRWFQDRPRPTIQALFDQAVQDSNQNAENTYVPYEDAEGEQALHAAEEVGTPLALASDESTPHGVITESFQDTDIREALQMLADDAKMSVIVDEKVKGVTNATITELTFDAALDKILMPLNLVWARQNGQYLVGLPDPDSALFAQIAEHHEFHPANFQANEILPVLPEKMKKYVRIVEKANVLIVDAPKRQSAAIIDRFNQIDQPVPQVILEAIVCIVSPDCDFKFGFDWSQAVNVNGADPFSVGVQSLGISGAISRGGAKQAFGDFAVTSAFVRLLAEHGYLAIRASPRVMAKNGEKANISINRETFFSPQALTTGGTSSTSQNFIFQQNIQKVDTGIVLDIVPQIRGDEVTINIEKAEVSEDVRVNSADASNPYPVINRRSVATTVHVRDGKTMVIGGLVQRQSVEHVSQVPGLSRLPLIGNAFKSIQRQDRDAEVVIFISPRIVMPSVAMERKPTSSFNR